MNSKLITLLSICIHICNEDKHVLLKRMLFDYAKSNLSKKEIVYLYIKLANVNTMTEPYILLKMWISQHTENIIKQFLAK